ncbi:isopenicillin N synthase family dioxygenase [Sandaracinus amylolyticus]|uniref:Oxidoreductase n=1 Tax=Sandaracinus amylolyticus TaxID=927083 RepID=A0A0F6W686_9BACT|nr:2-oxoglutarate and iron-dependent oxygenase domain-containing protein [Sandaracinus amylolyticus]AKF08473.1 Oxidoreductase [Sandaracinus amylolyticus]
MSAAAVSSEPSIPTVDLADLASTADPAARARAVTALREAFGVYGLVYVKGHGVSDVGALYDRFDTFTSRSLEEKQRFNRSDLWYQRGWTPPDTEKAVVASGQPDFKECWFCAPEPLPAEMKAQYPEIFADNVWPGDEELEARAMRAGHELHLAGLALLRGCALALGLPEGSLASRCEGGAHVFRLLRYLPLTAAQTKQKILWGEEHTDFNLLTLLPGGRFHDPSGEVAPAPDSGSGLYLRTRPSAEHPDGQLVRGTAPAGCIVAQVGQQLEILSGGTFLATPHVITAPHTPGWSRFSAAHFVHLNAHEIVFPLPEMRTPEAVRAYAPPVLAGTYSIKTLVDIGLAPKNALDKLGYRHYERLATIRARETTS